MVVEKVDPSSPSHGEIPGTAAYEIRKADAAPDVVLKAPDPGNRGAPLQFQPDDNLPQIPIPKTVISRADSDPSHGEVEGTAAYEMRKADATPDVAKRVGDGSGKPESFPLSEGY